MSVIKSGFEADNRSTIILTNDVEVIIATEAGIEV